MKYRNLLFSTALFLSAWIVPTSVLQAQPAGAEGEPEADCLPPSHRIRILAGPGRAILLPGFLSESGPTWMINSFIEAQDNSNYQPVIPFEPKEFEAFSLHGDIDYTWKDRLRLRFKTYQLEQDFDRDSSTRTDFFAPAKTNFRWAYFEGVRLQRYREDRRAGELLYVHPMFLPGLKLGAFVSSEQYIEINDISFGSFVATKNNAEFKSATTTWSELGLVPGEFRMFGTNVGVRQSLRNLQGRGRPVLERRPAWRLHRELRRLALYLFRIPGRRTAAHSGANLYVSV
jgi:hypothetical protein